MYQDRVSAIHFISKWRLIWLPLIIAMIVLAVLPAIFTPLFAAVLGLDAGALISWASALGMGATLVLGIFIMKKGSKLTLADLGLPRRKAVAKSLGGLLIGIACVSIVAMIILALGAITISSAYTSAALGPIMTAAVFFIFQGTWEELIYRAYLMPHFSKVMGDTWSITLTALLFAAFHAVNPGMQVLPAVNLIIYGFVFGLLYYRTGNLWLTGLAHSAWNFTQGYFYGSEVSGNAVTGSVLTSPTVPGKELISGGHFGFEGGLVATAFGLLLIVFLANFYPKNAVAK